MKKIVALLASLTSSFIIQSASADVLAQWTFEVNTPADLNNSATIGGIAADVGTGTASGGHASAGTDWSTPAGNGSANSLSANEWAIGDYFQFSVSTIGYKDVLLSWAQVSSSTGPGEFKLAYQVNGGGFVDFLNYTVLPNQAGAPGLGAWSSGSEIVGYNFSVNLSSVTLLNSASSVDFRLIMRTTADSTPPGTVVNTGTDRVDNFQIQASLVPEPSSSAIFAGFGVLSLVFYSRMRK